PGSRIYFAHRPPGDLAGFGRGTHPGCNNADVVSRANAAVGAAKSLKGSVAEPRVEFGGRGIVPKNGPHRRQAAFQGLFVNRVSSSNRSRSHSKRVAQRNQ